MRRKSFYTFFAALVLLLSACGGNSTSDKQGNSSNNGSNASAGSDSPTPIKDTYILNEERTFAHNVWNSQTPEVFEINITDPDAYYTIEFAVAIDTAVYRYETFPFYADIYTPDGTHRHLTPEFPLKQYGRWKGDMRDGYRVISKQLYEFFPFSKAGKQRIEVKQATS